MGANLILYACPDPSNVGLSHEQARARIIAFAAGIDSEKAEEFFQWYAEGCCDLAEAYENREEDEVPVEQLAAAQDEDPALFWGRRCIQKRLLAAYTEVVESDPRDVNTLTLGGMSLMASGGLSHGDDPTDSGKLVGMLEWSGVFNLPQRKGVLDLSTAHIPEQMLEENVIHTRQRVAVHEHGWVVFIPGDAEAEETLSEEFEWFRPILKLAWASDCLLVNFDKDADVCDLLPVYGEMP